jgi:hypothetical protein
MDTRRSAIASLGALVASLAPLACTLPPFHASLTIPLTPSAPELVTPGHRALRAPPMRTREVAYRLLALPASDSSPATLPTGRVVVTEAAVEHDGEPALLQVLRDPEGGLLDSLLVRRRDLAPIREHARVGDTSIRIEYSGARVRWTREGAGRPVQVSAATFDVPVFAQHQREMLVRALSTAPGRLVVVPVVSVTTQTVTLDTLLLMRGPWGGPTRVRVADPAVISRYLLDGRARDVSSLRVIVRASGTRLLRVPDPSSRPASRSPEGDTADTWECRGPNSSATTERSRERTPRCRRGPLPTAP